MLKLRHVGSILGFLWTLLNPLLYIATYWVVFTLFVRMGLDNYPLFLIPGFLAWNFTFGALVNSSESVINSNYLITKISFPNEILPLTDVGISLFDFLVSLILYFTALLIIPNVFEISSLLFLLPLIILMQILITIGLSLIVASLSVYFRDVPKLVQVGGTLLFFLTPIFYPLSFIPESLQKIVILNPIAQIITYYHDILYYGQHPGITNLLITGAASIVTLFIGAGIFNKIKSSFAELS